MKTFFLHDQNIETKTEISWEWNKLLTLFVSCISKSWIEIKIKLNFYFHTSLWYLKMFYGGL